MKSIVKMGAVLLAALTLAASSTNAQTPAPSAGTSTNAPAVRTRPKQISGKVASVDAAGKTITLTRKDGTSETLQVTSKTRIRKDGAPATLEDVTVGEQVLASYRKDDAGNLVAVGIRVGAAKKAPPAASTNAAPAGQ